MSGFLVCASEKIVAPLGWRTIILKDFPGSRIKIENTQVIADFNDDGLLDTALFLIQKDSQLLDLFIFFENTSKNIVPQKINKESWGGEMEYTLSLMEPGKYVTTKGIINFKNLWLMREEIEFGFGEIYWFNGKKWKNMSFARGDIHKVEG